MKIENIVPCNGHIVTRRSEADVKTESGFEVKENTDDFLIFAEVLGSSSDRFPVGTFVVFQDFMAQEFRDGADAFYIIHEEDIKGTYTP